MVPAYNPGHGTCIRDPCHGVEIVDTVEITKVGPYPINLGAQIGPTRRVKMVWDLPQLPRAGLPWPPIDRANRKNE